MSNNLNIEKETVSGFMDFQKFKIISDLSLKIKFQVLRIGHSLMVYQSWAILFWPPLLRNIFTSHHN